MGKADDLTRSKKDKEDDVPDYRELEAAILYCIKRNILRCERRWRVKMMRQCFTPIFNSKIEKVNTVPFIWFPKLAASKLNLRSVSTFYRFLLMAEKGKSKEKNDHKSQRIQFTNNTNIVIPSLIVLYLVVFPSSQSLQHVLVNKTRYSITAGVPSTSVVVVEIDDRYRPDGITKSEPVSTGGSRDTVVVNGVEEASAPVVVVPPIMEKLVSVCTTVETWSFVPVNM